MPDERTSRIAEIRRKLASLDLLHADLSEETYLQKKADLLRYATRAGRLPRQLTFVSSCRILLAVWRGVQSQPANGDSVRVWLLGSARLFGTAQCSDAL